jgi:hypothetical protein
MNECRWKFSLLGGGYENMAYTTNRTMPLDPSSLAIA